MSPFTATPLTFLAPGPSPVPPASGPASSPSNLTGGDWAPVGLTRRGLGRVLLGAAVVTPMLAATGLVPGLTPGAAAAAGAASLRAGETLTAGQSLVSPNGRYRLIMQGDGNLVLYDNGKALWATSTNGPNRRLVMQGDGNAVVYEGSTARWNSNTAGFGDQTYLTVQDDANLVMYCQGLPVWSRGHGGYIGHILFPGARMNSGAMRRSPNGRYRLIMQGDGNLVEYEGSKALWATSTNGPNRWFVMQGDGNAVVYEGSTPRWNSQTAGRDGARLILQDDANLVIYHGGTAVWSRGSGPISGGGTSSGRKVGTKMGSNTMYAGYCTWGALELWKQNTGYYLKVSGDAIAWDESAAANGWTVTATPEARSVFVKNSDTSGHVGWVRAVERRSDGVYIHTTEMNGGSTWTDKANAKTNEFGKFVDHVRKVTSVYRFILAP